MYARLEKLAELVGLARFSQSEKDRARMERTIQLVGRALRDGSLGLSPDRGYGATETRRTKTRYCAMDREDG